jgi:uracil-DNA glycosylase
MLIGITGGREEEERSEAFVGPSGRKINSVIRWAAEEKGVSSLPTRKLNVFNCRATTLGFQGRIVNRKAGGMTIREMRACASRWLFPELRKTKAKVVLILGTEAYAFIMGKRFDNFNKSMGHRLYVPKSGISPAGLGDTIYSFGEEVDWSDAAYDK